MLLEKLIVTRLVKFPNLLLEPEGSLPLSQELTTSPYPDPDESSPRLPILFPNIHYNINPPSTHSSSSYTEKINN
jgi:hypothetical protein